MQKERGEDAGVEAHGEELREDDRRPRGERAVDFALAREICEAGAEAVARLAGESLQAEAEEQEQGVEQRTQWPPVVEETRGATLDPEQHAGGEEERLRAERPGEEIEHVERLAFAVVEQRRSDAAAEREAGDHRDGEQRLPASGEVLAGQRGLGLRATRLEPRAEDAAPISVPSQELPFPRAPGVAGEQDFEVENVGDFPVGGTTHGRRSSGHRHSTATLLRCWKRSL